MRAEDLRCNTLVRWEKSLPRYAAAVVEEIARLWQVTPPPAAREQAEHQALGYLVRSYFDQVRPENLGALLLRGRSTRDEAGRERPLLVFRGAVTSTATGRSTCFDSLIRHGRVRHVINLYAGTFPFHDMIADEKRIARAHGVTYFDVADAGLEFRRLVEHEADYAKNLGQAMAHLARVIREQVLAPGGHPPRGNVYVHCGGGMHRSGMLIGVLRRCVNQDPLSEIEAEYRRHVAWASDAEPGGFEPLNLRFIREFDCGLLRDAPAPAPP